MKLQFGALIHDPTDTNVKHFAVDLSKCENQRDINLCVESNELFDSGNTNYAALPRFKYGNYVCTFGSNDTKIADLGMGMLDLFWDARSAVSEIAENGACQVHAYLRLCSSKNRVATAKHFVDMYVCTVPDLELYGREKFTETYGDQCFSELKDCMDFAAYARMLLREYTTYTEMNGAHYVFKKDV